MNLTVIFNVCELIACSFSSMYLKIWLVSLFENTDLTSIEIKNIPFLRSPPMTILGGVRGKA